MMKSGTLLIKNARAVLSDKVTEPLNILVENGIIIEIGSKQALSSDRCLDAAGGYVFPGFIDVHVHGGGGADFMDGTPEAFETAVKAHLAVGTTTIVPTAMTATREELITFINAYHGFKAKSEYSTLARGIHLEGPYFSKANGKSKGAQSGNLIRDIDMEEVKLLLELANGSILRWDAAPEVEKAEAFAAYLRDNGIICAVAHTNATAEETEKGFGSGFSHVTHFYNAVTAYMKREQVVTAGVVEATYLNEDVTVELICDGKHIPKHCMKLALKIKGPDKVIGITDATRIACTNMKSGRLGSLANGTDVIVDDGVAKLPDKSSYAGSICTMEKALKVLCVDYDIDVVTVAKMLSTNPAKHINIEDRTGSIEVGKDADFVITDDDFSVRTVIKGGKCFDKEKDKNSFTDVSIK